MCEFGYFEIRALNLEKKWVAKMINHLLHYPNDVIVTKVWWCVFRSHLWRTKESEEGEGRRLERFGKTKINFEIGLEII